MTNRLLQSAFGEIDGRQVDLHTLTNAQGMVVKISSYGGIVTSLLAPDRSGQFVDVVLGFENLASYVSASPYFGATVGRVANRIRGAAFDLEGRTYHLAANDKPHHLHGGARGWDKVLWEAQARDTGDGPALELNYLSPDGEEGYPGTIRARTVYTLTDGNELRVEMSARTERATIVNMVNHTYWNLAGAGSGTILEHVLMLRAESYTPGDPMVPTGVVSPVEGTAFDFRRAKSVGRDLRQAGGNPIGYDHNFVVAGAPNQMREVARLQDPHSGRVMTLEADQPGVQFYSGNFLDGTALGKGGKAYAQYTGLCLETQKFPNAVNVPAWKSQVLLKPDETYKHTMIHKFTAE